MLAPMPRPRIRYAVTSVALAATVPVTACKSGGEKTQVKAEYANTLESLLDMVGAERDGFMVVRDMRPMISLAKQARTMVDGPVNDVLAEVEKGGKNVDREEFEEFRGRFDALMDAVDGAGVKWDQGVVVHGQKGGDGIILFQAESVEKLKVLTAAVGAPDTAVTEHCANLDADPAWIACGESVEDAKAFKPGKQGKAVLDEVGKNLPGVEFDRVNLVFDFDEATIAMTSDPGLYEFAMTPKDEELEELAVLSAGAAKALRVVNPGDTFLWGRVNMEQAKKQAGGVPAPAKAMVDAIEGEYLLAGLSDPRSIIMQMGISDPYPVRSMIDLGWTQKDALPKSDPKVPGVSWTFEETEVKVAGETARVLSVLFAGEKIDEFGGMMPPRISALVGGGYLTFGVGLDANGAKALAEASGEGPSKELLNTLPAHLADALESKTALIAYHTSFDSLQSDPLRQSVADNLAKIDLPEKPPAPAIAGVLKFLAPFSELSFWLTRHETTPVFHFAIRTFGDDRTEEGKAALAALEASYAGKSGKEAYGPLVSKFGSSHRAASYKARAAQAMDEVSFGGPLALGVAAGIGAASFQKYIDRSKESAAMIEAQQAAMEAEAAAMEAQIAAEAANEAAELAADPSAP